MINLLRLITSVELGLLQHGLNVFYEENRAAIGDTNLGVYGGEYYPGVDYDKLIQAYLDGSLLGLCGLCIPEQAVLLDPQLRSHLGAVLQLADPECRFVTDRLSEDNWTQHLGFNSKFGGHPGWLANANDYTAFVRSEVISDNDGSDLGYVVHDIGEAMLAALGGYPCVLSIPPRAIGGGTSLAMYNPLVRWASVVGLQHCLAYSAEDVKEKTKLIRDGKLLPLGKDQIELQRNLARATLFKMIEHWKRKQHQRNEPMNILAAAGLPPAATTPATALDVGVFSPADILAAGGFLGAPAQPVVAGGPREFVIGTVFDPATHYTKEYFGGEAGLIYTRPDGTKDIYHGPANDWGAFTDIVKMMQASIPVGEAKTLIDIGCGAGGFVKHARAGGFNAHGVDISVAAIAAADPMVREYLLCADVTKGKMNLPTFEVVTALDFWEHIFHDEIDALIEGVKGLLAPGGIGFWVICTRGKGEQDWTIPRGACFSRENSWLLCSGHVTIRRAAWWWKKFQDHGLNPRFDVAYMFQTLRDEDPALRSVDSWRCKNLVVVEKAK